MMNRQRIMMWTLIAVSAVTLTVCGFVWAIQETVTAPSSDVSQRQQAAYTIGGWQGKLAVYVGGSNTPRDVYDIYISSFPPQEQEKLTAGIPVQNEEELNSLLEDYTS